MFRGAMPDLKVVVEDMVAEGDKVAGGCTLEGSVRGEPVRVLPAGQERDDKKIAGGGGWGGQD